jgi:hypothetical protein
MALNEFLCDYQAEILEAASASLARAGTPHYDGVGAVERRNRLEALFAALRAAAEIRDRGAIRSYAKELAKERYCVGFDLSEVQTAFNALEEAVWRCVFAHLRPDEYIESLGLVSSILGAGKDELAREYVSLATQAHVPSLDLDALIVGTTRP